MSDDPASQCGLRWEMRRSLVERLRIPWDAMGDMANAQRAEAAVQISTMLDEIEAWRQAMQRAERDLAELRGMLEVANEMAEQYAQERDEARREVCQWAEHNLSEDAKHIARDRGWDCFKENP